MEKYKYLIKGQPVSFSKAHYALEAGFSSAKETQLIWRITLQSQHQDRELISEEIEVFYDFYFSNLIKCNYHGRFVKVTNDVAELIKFASEMATGTIWKDPRQVVRSTAEKYHSVEARTEITVIKLVR